MLHLKKDYGHRKKDIQNIKMHEKVIVYQYISKIYLIHSVD